MVEATKSSLLPDASSAKYTANACGFRALNVLHLSSQHAAEDKGRAYQKLRTLNMPMHSLEAAFELLLNSSKILGRDAAPNENLPSICVETRPCAQEGRP